MPQIMNPIAIPSSELEPPKDVEFKWPKGAWIGTIAESTTKLGTPRSKTGERFAGFISDDAEFVSFRLTDNQPFEGQPSVGNRIQFIDLTVKDGDYDLSSGEIPEDAWKLTQDRKAFVKLAFALGETEIADVENTPMTVVKEGFLDALAAGQYNGRKLGFIVAYNKRGYPYIANYFTA